MKLIVSLAALALVAGQSDPFNEVASQRPFDVATALVHAGVPVGIEVRRGEDTPTVQPTHDGPIDAAALSVIIGNFNRTHRDYAASADDGVVVIRPVVHRSSVLDREVRVPPRLVVGLDNALRLAFSTIDAPLDTPGGVAGSYINTTPEMRGDNVPLRLSTSVLPLVSHLDSLVRQSGQQGWFVVTEPTDDSVRLAEFGLLYRGGSLSKTHFSTAVRDQ
jgi:hypothetical protein